MRRCVRCRRRFHEIDVITDPWPLGGFWCYDCIQLWECEFGLDFNTGKPHIKPAMNIPVAKGFETKLTLQTFGQSGNPAPSGPFIIEPANPEVANLVHYPTDPDGVYWAQRLADGAASVLVKSDKKLDPNLEEFLTLEIVIEDGAEEATTIGATVGETRPIEGFTPAPPAPPEA